jgi:Tfp pilus assembly protein PilW
MPTTPKLGEITGTTSISDTEANRRYGPQNNPSAYTVNFYGITDINEIMRHLQQFFGGTKGIS